mgnify:CR=1 FL=1
MTSGFTLPYEPGIISFYNNLQQRQITVNLQTLLFFKQYVNKDIFNNSEGYAHE